VDPFSAISFCYKSLPLECIATSPENERFLILCEGKTVRKKMVLFISCSLSLWGLCVLHRFPKENT
jgi:hypothetical protein